MNKNSLNLVNVELTDKELDLIVGGLAPVSAIGFQLGLNHNYFTSYRAPSVNLQRKQIQTNKRFDNEENKIKIKTHNGQIDFMA